MEDLGFASACSTLLCPHMTGPCNHKGSSSWKSRVFCKWLQTGHSQHSAMPSPTHRHREGRSLGCSSPAEPILSLILYHGRGQAWLPQQLQGHWQVAPAAEAQDWARCLVTADRTTTGMRIYQRITLFSRGLWLKHIAKEALLDKKWHLWGHIDQMTGLRRRHAADCWQLQGKEFESSYISEV